MKAVAKLRSASSAVNYSIVNAKVGGVWKLYIVADDWSRGAALRSLKLRAVEDLDPAKYGLAHKDLNAPFDLQERALETPLQIPVYVTRQIPGSDQLQHVLIDFWGKVTAAIEAESVNPSGVGAGALVPVKMTAEKLNNKIREWDAKGLLPQVPNAYGTPVSGPSAEKFVESNKGIVYFTCAWDYVPARYAVRVFKYDRNTGSIEPIDWWGVKETIDLQISDNGKVIYVSSDKWDYGGHQYSYRLFDSDTGAVIESGSAVKPVTVAKFKPENGTVEKIPAPEVAAKPVYLAIYRALQKEEGVSFDFTGLSIMGELVRNALSAGGFTPITPDQMKWNPASGIDPARLAEILTAVAKNGQGGFLEIAGVPAAIPEAAKVPVAATPALKARMQEIDAEAVKQLDAIDTFVDLDRLVKEAPGYVGMAKEKAKEKLAAEVKDVLSGARKVGREGKALETKFFDGFAVGNRLLAHADIAGGAVEHAEDMVRKADAGLVARLRVHEVLHHILGDAEHKIMSGEELLRDRLLSEHLMKSTAAEEAAKALIGEARDLSVFRNLPANVKSPSVIYITADPDNMNLLHAAIEKRKDNKNLKIIIAYNDNYTWTADYREKLMKQYPGIVAGFVKKSELNDMIKEGKDMDDALVLAARKTTNNDKLTAQDIGFIGSAEGMYVDERTKQPIDFSVAKGLKKIPEIRPVRKGADEFHDVGTLIDVADLAVMAHRILGDKYDPKMTFAKLADALGGDLKDALLEQVKAAGLDAGAAVAEGLVQIPPTTKGVTGELQNSINSLRSTLIAA